MILIFIATASEGSESHGLRWREARHAQTDAARKVVRKTCEARGSADERMLDRNLCACEIVAQLGRPSSTAAKEVASHHNVNRKLFLIPIEGFIYCSPSH